MTILSGMVQAIPQSP